MEWVGTGMGPLCHPIVAWMALRVWAQRCWHPTVTRHMLQACPVPMGAAAFGSNLEFWLICWQVLTMNAVKGRRIQRPGTPGEKQTGMKPNTLWPPPQDMRHTTSA